MPKRLNNKHSSKHNPESGNVFVIVMLGVILFGALMFTFSRGMRTGGEGISNKQAVLYAVDLIATAQQYERAVQRLLRKGISENDISFVNSYTPTDYSHTPVQSDSNKVFHTNGGRARYQLIPESALETGQTGHAGYANFFSYWSFGPLQCIWGIGTGTATCGSSSKELMINAYYIKESVCKAINRKLGINLPDGTPSLEAHSGGTFIGFFPSSPRTLGDADTELQEQPAACILDTDGTMSGKYIFYYTLMAR